MKKLALTCMIAGVGVAISSTSLCATLHSLSKAQFLSAFVNKTLVSVPIDNLNGKTIHNTFSVYLDDQGRMVGRMSINPANQPQTDTGVYSIDEDGTAHMTWKHWDNAQKLCFHVFNTENTYLSVECDNVFHTAFMKEAIKPGNNLEY